MNDRPLISPHELASLLDATSVLDIRWELARGALRDEYLTGHIPGAAFVSLDTDLAGPAGDGGRHPLPGRETFEQAMRAAGVSDHRPVVVYDQDMSTAAARAWWLLRHHGHSDVRVLDGGFDAWVRAGLSTERGEPPQLARGEFSARPGAMPVLDAAAAAELARTGVLLDARAGERFRGEQEPVDPVAGHIPGAVNRPTTENVGADGHFADAETLRAAFQALRVRPDTSVGVYCGSGVTAAHQVLALELAGHRAALYPGSWSEWIRDPQRPVATGGA